MSYLPTLPSDIQKTVENSLRAELMTMPLWMVTSFSKFIDGDDYEPWSPQYLLMYNLIEKHIPSAYTGKWHTNSFKWIFVEVAMKCWENLDY